MNAPATESALDALVTSLLYEGYALYPYTPGAIKNATPTPFGILYPTDYARQQPHTFDHLQLECVLAGPANAELAVEVRWLQPSGERHQAAERRANAPAWSLESIVRAHRSVSIPADAPDTLPCGRIHVAAEAHPGDLWFVRVRIENLTRLAEHGGAMDRPAALRRAFLSTHVILRLEGARFVSPLERDGTAGALVTRARNVNTWPVLAGPAEDVLLGAAIVLPDHPQLAPESRGNLFDNTEIEEALLLHVRTLTDAERAAIGEQDPAVRELLQRALEATPAEMMKLHAMMRPAVPSPAAAVSDVGASENFRYLTRPRDDTPQGESRVETASGTLSPGQRVRLRLGRTTAHDPMYDGKVATIGRIVVDDQGRPHLGVTLDDDPGRDVLGDSGRFLYFFPHEIEVLA